MEEKEEVFLQIQPELAAREAPALPDEVLSVIRLFDGSRSLGDVVEASPLDVSLTLAVVQRAAELGLLTLGQRCPQRDSRWRHVSGKVKRWLDGSPGGCKGEGESTGLDWSDELEELCELDDLFCGDGPKRDELGEPRAEVGAEMSLEAGGSGGQGRPPVAVDGLPQALERSLKRALERYLDPEVDGTHPDPSELYGELDRCLDKAFEKPVDELLSAAKKPAEEGFTESDLEFFDSYEPEPEKEETIEELLMDPAPAP
jgi:hypothetical protein